jgi:hypothetical protein
MTLNWTASSLVGRHSYWGPRSRRYLRYRQKGPTRTGQHSKSKTKLWHLGTPSLVGQSASVRCFMGTNGGLQG